MSKINIAGIDKAELFAALYNHAKPMGMGFLHFDPTPLDKESAEKLMARGDDSHAMFPGMSTGRALYFDYVKGRPLKIDLSGDEMDTYLYNRDQGDGAAERIVAELRKK